MKKINVNITMSKVSKEGEVSDSNQDVEITVPPSNWNASDISGFSMQQDGNGSYFGPNQMFGGPKGGELVLFPNKKNGRAFYAIITSMTQDWHSRTCGLRFLCWRDELFPRIKDGLFFDAMQHKLTYEQIMPIANKMYGFEEAVDLCIEIAREQSRMFIYGDN